MQSQSDRDARIRDRAYQIWLTEGRRHGHHDTHWQQAEREIAAEEAAAANGKKPGSARPSGARAKPATSEANPVTVGRAPAKGDTAAKKPRARSAALKT